MEFKFHRHFKKSFDKMPLNIQNKIEQTLRVFAENPFHQKLKNHILSGNLQDKKAISVTGDIRIIFEEFDNYTLVLFLEVGSHSQVYKKPANHSGFFVFHKYYSFLPASASSASSFFLPRSSEISSLLMSTGAAFFSSIALI